MNDPNGRQPRRRRYPPVYERLVPIALGIIVLAIVLLLVVLIRIAMGQNGVGG